MVLDAIAGNQDILNLYQNKLSQYQNAKKEYEQLITLREESVKIHDYNQFLFDELIDEDLTANMLTKLEEEIAQLSNVETLQNYLSKELN